MFKNVIPVALCILTMASCSSLKPLNSTSRQVSATPAASVSTEGNTENKKVKFLDNITVESQSTSVVQQQSTQGSSAKGHSSSSDINAYLSRNSSIEKASPLQLKYAVLLNTEVESLMDARLLESVDDWYGTRYRMGGTTKKGVDCSAFVQAVYLSAFAVSLPRTAREQYKSSRIISATELREGDLVFFNTRGGVSHVGIYMQNNKFVHASTSYGVTVSDMFDPYYLKRFIGAGRIEKPEAKNVVE